MAAEWNRYRCDGFNPIKAANIKHAALLFAVRIARQKYGPKGRCSTLELRADLGDRGASFEAFLGIPKGVMITGASHSFTVLIEREPSGETDRKRNR